jgi:hypothetical protein
VEVPRSILKPLSSVELSVQPKVSWAASTPVCARVAAMNKKQMAKARLRKVFRQIIFISSDGIDLTDIEAVSYKERKNILCVCRLFPRPKTPSTRGLAY